MKLKELFTNIGAKVGGAIGLCGLIITGAEFMHNRGGTLSASMNGQTLDNKTSKDIVVFMDDPHTSLRLSSLSPTFSNSSSYSIRDFHLDYHVTTTGVQFEQTDYYSLYNDGDGSCTLKFNENVLPGSRRAEAPFKGIVIPENGGRMTITAEATYDGSSEPFSCTFNETFVVVPYERDMSYEGWKEKCNSHFTGTTTASIFYVDNHGNIEYAENFDLAKQLIAEKKQGAQKSAQTPETQQKAPEHPKASEPSQQMVTITEGKKAASNDFRKNLSISFKQHVSPEDGRLLQEFEVFGLPVDSVVILSLLIEDTEGSKAYNSTALIKGYNFNNATNQRGSYILHLDSCILKDYAICEECPSLADSIDITDNQITNKTAHAIIVEYKDKGATTLLKPFEEKHRMLYADGELRYYNIPTSVLTEDYMPKKYKGPLWAIPFYALCIAAQLFLIVMFICLFCAEVKDARDLWYFMTDSDNLLIMLLLFAMIAFTAFMVNELGIALLWWI